MPENIVIVGHPLCAEENRLPFQGLNSGKLNFIVPDNWNAHSLGTHYLTEDDPDHNLKTCGVHFSGHNSLYAYRGLAGLLEECKPGLIYCWEEPWCVSAFQTSRWAKKNGVKFIFYSAENKTKKLPLPFYFMQKYVYKNSHGAIVITEQARERLNQSGYINSIYQVPLWIRQLPLRDNLNKNKTLIYIGRLIPLKRVDLLIRTLRHIPDFSLEIIGDGPDSENLSSLTRSERVSDRVKFHGKVDNNRLFTMVKNSGMAIFPTGENKKQAEQFGKAALECICMGLPVIASNTGNFTEMSRRLKTLFSETLTEPEQIAESVKQHYENYPDRMELEKSREWVLNNFSFKTVSLQFDKLFDSILKR